MIKRWMERRRLEKAAKEEAKRVSAQEQRAVREAAVEALTATMLARPCPMNRASNCFRECVHFRSGYVFWMPVPYSGEVVYFTEGPRCKLWGRK